MDPYNVPKWLFSKYPIVCTLCGGSYEHKGKRVLYPWPMNHYLCFNCFNKSMKEGIARLNIRLVKGELDITIEEIAEEIKPSES